MDEEEEEEHISLYRQHRLWGPWVGDSFTTSCCRGRRWSRERQSVQINPFPFTSRLDRYIVQGVEMSEYANELLMELSQFAQEMAVEAC